METMNFEVFKKQNGRGSTWVPPSPPTPAEIEAVRKKLGLSLRLFARLLGVPTTSLCAWIYNVNTPDAAATKLLRLAMKRPEVLLPD